MVCVPVWRGPREQDFNMSGGMGPGLGGWGQGWGDGARAGGRGRDIGARVGTHGHVHLETPSVDRQIRQTT